MCLSCVQAAFDLISQSVEISHILEVPAKNIVLKASTRTIDAHYIHVHVHCLCLFLPVHVNRAVRVR